MKNNNRAGGIGRRPLLAAAAGLATGSALGAGLAGSVARAQEAQPFSYEWLIEDARRRAVEGFVDRNLVSRYWRELSFDDYRQIRFRVDRALWRGERLFSLQFFHPGLYFDHTVPIHVIRDGQASEIAYDPTMFDFGGFHPEELDGSQLGFAGFRVHYPLHVPATLDEFAVFLGASYFRLVGRNQQYGLSARGLAVDTAGPNGEEFPSFTEFWIEEPPADGTELTFYALLDSERCTGAYRFILRPRTDSQIDVRATIFPRETIDKLGIAPLTSMFKHGEGDPRTFDDFRPEVHDSDGLMVHTGPGEWIWRPLVNRRDLQITSFGDTNPQGFGLIQRDRDFAHYQDLEAHYHQRPSFWIQPLGGWGRGRVELVEIPTDTEVNDNIVAYWVPEVPIEAGGEYHFAYLLNAFLENSTWPPGGRVTATRVGTARRPGSSEGDDGRLFVIDFINGDLPYLQAGQPVEAVAGASVGRLGEPVAIRNEETGGWRAFFDFFPDGNDAADLRCYLRLRGHALTETWSYLWTG